MAPPTHQLKLRFFDLDVHIRSDARTYLEPLAQMYHRFQANGDPPSLQPPLELAIFTWPDDAWGQPMLILDGDVRPLQNVRGLAGYVHQSILCAILTRVRRHILIRAGAVAHDGQGIILAADSYHDKTALILELVRRGCKFLSDETAALGRADWRVHPFPRGLKIRPGALDLTSAADAAPEWPGKALVHVEQFRPDSLGQAVPVRHVVVLQDPAKEEKDQADGSGQEWLLDSIVNPVEPSNSATPARLETMSRSKAATELLRRFQGKSAILDELGGSPTRLGRELAVIVGQAQCHRLFVGPVDEMADRVCELVRKE